MSDPRIRLIKIKTAVVKRLLREKVLYDREAELQKDRVQKYKDEGKDEHEVRKQEEVLQECLMMIPDCQRRLVRAFQDLSTVIDTELDLKDKVEYLAAVKVLEDMKKELPPPRHSIPQFC